MARSDLLVSLVQSGIRTDKVRFRKVVEAIIAEERAKRHEVLASKLDEVLNTTPAETVPTNGGVINSSQMLDQRLGNFVHETIPRKKIDELILSNETHGICRELIQEHHRCDLLRSYNLEPRNKLLLIGPPGNGKTSLAETIAEALMVPFLTVRYENIIGTYLGETANRLRKLIDFACTRKCVLFFDEFETLGKERGDIHETGEIKRVVSSLLLQIDSLPSHVVVIGATNHSELLDRAVWRRFQIRIILPKPTKSKLIEWFDRFERRVKVPLGFTPTYLATKFTGVSFAEVEEFGTNVFRQFVLDQPNSDMKAIVARNLKQWASRTVTAEK